MSADQGEAEPLGPHEVAGQLVSLASGGQGICSAGAMQPDANAWTSERRLFFGPNGKRYNHDVFRFPARFHSPVARALVAEFSRPGQRVLDPFCGSDVLLVEALIADRHAAGTDVDPVAVFVSRAKIQVYDLDIIEKCAAELSDALQRARNRDLKKHGDFTSDVDATTYAILLRRTMRLVPAIPKLTHWFRKRVVLQLARIVAMIESLSCDDTERMFFSLCFASVIRNASNADPVPVSGLEVTQHMRRREALGRNVDPYELMGAAVRRGLSAARAYAHAREGRSSRGRVAHADVRTLRTRTWTH